MKKVLYLIILLIPFTATALTYPELHYEKAIIYDMTDDKILYSEQSEEKSSIASLTKIMTTITAIENISNLDNYITYTEDMASQVRWDASVAGLKVNDQITYRDLLYASILPSGADATTALAITTSGSIEKFVQKMNETADKIGMKNSHFVNVTGLDADNHYSTAEDILKLLKYSFKNETFKRIYTTKTYTLSNSLFVRTTLYAYRGDSDRILGSKTGFTLGAGRCISAYFKSNDHEFILITLGSPSNETTIHIADALELIDFIDNNYHTQTLVEKDCFIKELIVKESKIENYTINTKSNVTKYLPDDYDRDKISFEYEGLNELSYKNKQNEKIGEIKYYYDNEFLLKEDVLLEETIEKDIFKIIGKYKNLISITLAILIFIVIGLTRKKRKLS